jgi:S-layer protein
MANEVSIHAPGSLAIYQSVDGVLTATSGTATLADAVAIVDEEGVGTLAAVTIGANTYVIENNGGTLNSDESNTALASADTIVTLTGVSNVDGFAWVGAALADLGQYTPISSAGQSISITADPGQTWQNVTDFTDTGSAAPGTTTYYETIDHTSTGVPGAFAGLVLDTAATGSTIQYLDVANWGFMEVGGTSGIDTNNVTGGNVEVSQVGTGAEFGLIANNGGFTLNGFTYDNGASGGTLIIDPLDGNIVLGQLTDAGPLLVITGGDDVTIGTAASTGFTFAASNGTFIDAQSFDGDLYLGTEALPVTGSGLTIDVTDGYFGSSYAGDGATIFANGDGDIINVGNVYSVTMPWDTEETGNVVIQAAGQGDTISVNIDCSGPGPGAIVGAAGNGDNLTLVGGDGLNVPLCYSGDDTVILGVISAAGNKDSAFDLAVATLINVDVSASGANCDLAIPLGSQDVSLGTGDVIQIGDPSGNNCNTTAIAWLGGDNTVTIGYGAPADGSSLGADGTITADIWVSGAGDETGATISNTATDLSGITHETISWDGCANLNLFFFNEANESLAGCTWANSVVNVSTVNAPTLGAALNIAATQAAVLDQNFADGANTSTAGGTLAIDHSTGLIDWFQYGGNTYIVEANNNSTTAAAAHTALGSHDVVIELIGLVNPGDIGINHAYHTVAI